MFCIILVDNRYKNNKRTTNPTTRYRGSQSFEQKWKRNPWNLTARASIHPPNLALFKLRLGIILSTFQTLGIHPCLHRTMHKSFILPFINRIWDFTAAAQVYPKEEIHAHMSDKGRELEVKKIHTAGRTSTTALSCPARGGSEE